jgi:hypothetical protein
MSENIRSLSLSQATALARELALAYASEQKLEGSLLEVGHDEMETEKRGKTPVHWFAVFTAVHKGVELDGPIVFRINLETRSVSPANAV